MSECDSSFVPTVNDVKEGGALGVFADPIKVQEPGRQGKSLLKEVKIFNIST